MLRAASVGTAASGAQREFVAAVAADSGGPIVPTKEDLPQKRAESSWAGFEPDPVISGQLNDHPDFAQILPARLLHPGCESAACFVSRAGLDLFERQPENEHLLGKSVEVDTPEFTLVHTSSDLENSLDCCERSEGRNDFHQARNQPVAALGEHLL